MAPSPLQVACPAAQYTSAPPPSLAATARPALFKVKVSAGLPTSTFSASVWRASIQARPARSVSLKVSEKGGVSVYGLGRFPITFYKEQWIKLLGMSEEILAFIRANEGKLKVKE